MVAAWSASVGEPLDRVRSVVLLKFSWCMAAFPARVVGRSTVLGFAIVAFTQAPRNRRQARLLGRKRIVQMQLLNRVRGVVLLGFDEIIASLLARARRRFARVGSGTPVCAGNRLQARYGVFKFADLVFGLVNAQARPLLFYLKPEG